MTKFANIAGIDVLIPTPEQLAARQRWVALLREGKYRPLRKALATRSGASRCCLGVACDPVVHGLDLEVKGTTSGGQRRLVFDGNPMVLPVSVQEALGVNKNPDVVNEAGRPQCLASLNDEGVPHTILADYIERVYVAPFLDSQEG